jgi:hypothetical protein
VWVKACIRKQGRDCVNPIALSLSTYLTDFLLSQVMWNEQHKSIFSLLHNNSVLKETKMRLQAKGSTARPKRQTAKDCKRHHYFGRSIQKKPAIHTPPFMRRSPVSCRTTTRFTCSTDKKKNTHTYIYTYIHTYIHSYIHTYTRMIHTYVCIMHTYDTCIHTYIRARVSQQVKAAYTSSLRAQNLKIQLIQAIHLLCARPHILLRVRISISIRQHTSAYVSILQHTSAYVRMLHLLCARPHILLRVRISTRVTQEEAPPTAPLPGQERLVAER